jgi:hypothetical protein
MPNSFRIHPAIGIARLGDSTTEFCLTPETARGLPIKCDNEGRALLDAQGREQPVDTFKDAKGRIKRQAARFRVYVYQDANDTRGRELKIGDTVEVVKWQTGDLLTARLLDIEWTVYLANKKASWYQFKELQGEHGYAPDHPLRNTTITDPAARQRLIIDPGPQTVSYSQKQTPRRAEFAKGKNAAYPQSFPPALAPYNVETLGELIVQQEGDHNRLLVLGGYGCSGSFKASFGEPQIVHFANNDGWFDDVADGPVTARLWVQILTDDGDPAPADSPQIMAVAVDDPAWVLTASPSYVPEIENMITLDDIAYDVALRHRAHHPDIYTHGQGWNKAYYPYFYRDIWPILRRPDAYQWVMVFDPLVGGDPHSTAAGGSGNLDLEVIAIPPYVGQDPAQAQTNAAQRQFIYSILRKPGQENLFQAPLQDNYQPPLMPLLCGDNPLENTLPSKFLRLTDTQLFVLQQWANGKFINEKLEGLEAPVDLPPASGHDLDRGVLWNALGGAFCPGGEVCWIIRNPDIYAGPYRIKHAPYTPGSLSQPAVVLGADSASDLSKGLEPGDLTKYGPLPWQADFNECASQDIDVTYEGWVNLYPASIGDPAQTLNEQTIFWWPAHRPMEVFLPHYDSAQPTKITAVGQIAWTRTLPQSNAGDLAMVTAWKSLGFIRNVASADSPQFVETERNDGSNKPPVIPGA